ncbi:MAG: hypothetical protein ACJAXR_002058 [Halopseudomonas sp.]|jgi:hypothetical protein
MVRCRYPASFIFFIKIIILAIFYSAEAIGQPPHAHHIGAHAIKGVPISRMN